MYCFILFRMSSRSKTRYARIYHYSNNEELAQNLDLMRSNGNVIIDVQQDIDNLLVSAL